MRKSIFTKLGLAIAMMALCSVSFATTYNVYVGAPNSGTDWNTLMGAMAVAGDGDTIHITDGSAQQGGNVTVPNLTILGTDTGSGQASITSTASYAGLVSTAGLGTLTVNDLSISGMAWGIGLNKTMTFSASNLTISGVANDGFYLSDQGGGVGGAININLTSSSVSSGRSGVWVNNNVLQPVNINLNGTSISSNGRSGISYFGAVGTSAIVATNGSQVNNNGYAGLEIGEGTLGNVVNSTVDISFTDSTISGNAVRGIITSGGNSDFSVTLNNSTMANTDYEAIAFYSSGSAEADLDVTLENGSVIDMTGVVNAPYGIFCGADAPTLGVTVNDSSIVNSNRAIYPNGAFTGTLTVTGTNPVFNGCTGNVIQTDNSTTLDVIVNLTNITADFTGAGVGNRLIAHNGGDLDLDINGGTLTAFGKQAINVVGNAAAMTVCDVDIDNVTFTGSGAGGVNEIALRLKPAAGTVTADFTNCTVSNTAGPAIRLEAEAAPANNVPVVLDGTSISNAMLGVAVEFASTLTADGLSITNSILSGIQSNAPMTGDLSNSTISSNAGSGIYNAGPATDWTLTNCTIDGNAGWGMNQEGGGSLTATNTTFDGNSAPAGTGGGYAAGTTATTMDLTSCSFSNNGGDGTVQNHGILLWNAAVVYDVSMDNCTIDGNTMTGISARLDAAGSQIVSTGVNGRNSISGNNGTALADGLYVVNGVVSLEACDIQNNGREGIYSNTQNADITLTNSTVNNNAHVGILVDGGSASPVELITSTVDGNGAQGVLFTETAGASLTLDGSSITNNTGEGFYLISNAVANTHTVTTSNNSHIDGNGGNGNFRVFLVAADALFTCNLSDTSFDDHTAQWGWWIDQVPAGMTVTATDCTWSTNAAGSILRGVNTTTPITMNLNGCTFDGNGDALSAWLDVDRGALDLTASGTAFASTGTAIYLNNDGGSIDLSECTFTNNGAGINVVPGDPASVTLTTCTMTTIGAQGVWIQSANSDLTVTDSSFSGVANTAVQVAGADCTADVTGSTFDANGYAIYLVGTNLDATVADTTVTGTTQVGGLFANAGGQTLDVSNSTFNTNKHGVEILSDGVVATIDGCTMEGNTFHGLEVNGGGVKNITVTNTDIIDSVDSGVNLFNGGVLTLAMTDVAISGSGNHGIASTYDQVLLTMDNVDITGSTGHGIYNQSGIGATFEYDLTNGCSVSGNTLDGMYFYIPFGGLDLNISDANLDGNAGAAIVNQGTPVRFDGVFTNSTISGNGSGIITGGVNDAPGSLTLTNTVVENNTIGNGIYVAGQTSVMDVTLSGCTIDSNSPQNIYFAPAVNARGLVEVVDSTISNSVDNNIYLNLADDASAVLSVSGGTIEGAGTSAIALVGTSSADVISTLTQVTVAGNGVHTFNAPFAGTTQIDIVDCDIDATSQNNAVFGAMPAIDAVVNVDIVDTDVLPGNNAVVFHYTTGTLMLDVEHTTFNKTVGGAITNGFIFDNGDAESYVNFDQCDFLSTVAEGMTAVWVRVGSEGDYAGTVTVVDSIFDKANIQTHVASAATQDYNLFSNGASAVVVDAGDWGAAANSITGDSGYTTTNFGAYGYLTLASGSDAIGLNSGNGPETYAGAKGGFNSVQHWSIFE